MSTDLVSDTGEKRFQTSVLWAVAMRVVRLLPQRIHGMEVVLEPNQEKIANAFSRIESKLNEKSPMGINGK